MSSPNTSTILWSTYIGGKTWFDKGVQLVTRGPGSHTEIVFPERGVMFSSSKRDGGVRIKQDDREPHKWVDIAIDLSLADEMELWVWAEEMTAKGLKYDSLAILFTHLIPINRQWRNRWFCNEICLEGLKHIGWLPERIEPHKYNPNNAAKLVKSIRAWRRLMSGKASSQQDYFAGLEGPEGSDALIWRKSS